MSIAMEYAKPGERTVARKLIRTLLGKGLSLSVNDGEETTLRKARKESEILMALATTELDKIYAYRDDECVGAFLLVWGNEESGECLIADHTDNKLCETVWSEVTGEPVA